MKERLHLGGDAVIGVELRDPRQILVARLMGDAQVLQHGHRQGGNGRRHGIGQDARALTATDHQDRHRIVAGRNIGGIGAGQDAGAHRVAGVNRLCLGRHVTGPGATGHGLDPALASEKRVDPAKNAVLFVDHAGQAQNARRCQRRDRRVAAKSDNHRRAVAHHAPRRRDDAARDAKRCNRLGQQPATGKGGACDLLDLDRMGKATGIARAALVG